MKNLVNSEPLFLAIQKGELESVQQHLESGMSVHECNRHGYSALYYACSMNKPDIALYLLKCGAVPTFADSAQYTPLHWAAKYDQQEVVESLLSNGADPFQQNELGYTACHFAIKYQKHHIVEYFLAHSDPEKHLKLQTKKGLCALELLFDSISDYYTLTHLIVFKRHLLHNIPIPENISTQIDCAQYHFAYTKAEKDLEQDWLQEEHPNRTLLHAWRRRKLREKMDENFAKYAPCTLI